MKYWCLCRAQGEPAEQILSQSRGPYSKGNSGWPQGHSCWRKASPDGKSTLRWPRDAGCGRRRASTPWPTGRPSPLGEAPHAACLVTGGVASFASAAWLWELLRHEPAARGRFGPTRANTGEPVPTVPTESSSVPRNPLICQRLSSTTAVICPPSAYPTGEACPRRTRSAPWSTWRRSLTPGRSTKPLTLLWLSGW